MPPHYIGASNIQHAVTTYRDTQDAVSSLSDKVQSLCRDLYNSNVERDTTNQWIYNVHGYGINTTKYGITELNLRKEGIEIKVDLSEEQTEKLIKDLQHFLDWMNQQRTEKYLGKVDGS